MRDGQLQTLDYRDLQTSRVLVRKLNIFRGTLEQ